ncbi:MULTISPECIES: RBBP9/YdeN family alpha/beta hydrolase [Actinoalloteichus]|uniref:Esterase of the alpha/beta hydrolase fold n=1 Tax=Actinoalloteichus fjordicus TaxID=1612552 RepID=A0AAC9PQY2_9PSEU|nr:MULTISPECIES: alpha/beta hydrolase [Actinoalloteichus]APU13684.1 putative esterase of the alpha/beta hydrolase fold [Actinoalloteichus fjordicus]APU19630.1 putative esterase of the alpha/beta hydrolase fold [Actinoalloteichus sp. GBA129-24]
MSDRQVLLLHGWRTPTPDHWQLWLAPRAYKHGWDVDFPRLPAADTPMLADWLPVVQARVARVPRATELVVVAHCCGALTWMHHAAVLGGRGRRADRVLLVAPPGRRWRHPDLSGMPYPPVDGWSLRRAAGVTRLVAGVDDPWGGVAETTILGRTLGVEVDVVPGGRHLDPESGFGPWPQVLDWLMDPGAADLNTARRDPPR